MSDLDPTTWASGSRTLVPVPAKQPELKVEPEPELEPVTASAVQEPTNNTICFGSRTSSNLNSKLQKHNSVLDNERQTSLTTLQVVYRRGAHSYRATDPKISRDEFAMKRVDAFLHLLKSGRAVNTSYTMDNDLLPPAHPLFHSETALTASAVVSELTLEDRSSESFASPEEVIVFMTELSGFGYDAEPAFRASWLRAVKNNEDPFKRVSMLASMTYDSLDADLLPKRELELNK